MLKRILIGAGALVIMLMLIILGGVFTSIKSGKNEPPPQLIANFVDLNKIEKISRYRSCAGHTTVPQDRREMKRNMKHYFWVKKENIGNNTIEIYAPYDGYVSAIRSETEKGLEGEIWISSEKTFAMMPPFGRWNISFQHINVRKGLKLGSEVRAGELIGYAAVTDRGGDSFDVIYAKMSLFPKKVDNWRAPFSDLDSIFNHMNDEVFAEYREQGLSIEKLIMSKEDRDQDPCQYSGEGPQFIGREDDWAELR